ncbi:conserved Plasmodium protein, unknown function [Plasmodium malariae]|uniref:Uncharacterized protein n=1 Tax=Plasmodium malariae TaxID=5858 RepID=A0A1C3KLU3_PLAMA|nr:conserved Plasmodium protein, unknown function [Plasmodium malariae]
MAEKKIDDSPFLSKIENFEISDKTNKISKNEGKNVYKSLDNEFNFDEEKEENENEYEQEQKEEGKKENLNNQKNDTNIRTIKIDRKNLKKIFSSQFFTQTLTDDSSINSISDLKINKKYAIFEFFKTLVLIILFFTTSYFAFFYILNNYFGQNHICSRLDLYNYKYEDSVQFASSISNKKYYVFTGKFPFDVITYKLRKDVLTNSMNEEIEKYNKENYNENFEKIENLDDHQLQIISFMKYNNKMKCEKKIFDLYKPFHLKKSNVNMNNFDFILNEVNYTFITNPYNVPENKLYAAVLNFMKKSESKNRICYITSYLKSLKDDRIMESKRILSENNISNIIPNREQANETTDNNKNTIPAITENGKGYLKNGNTHEQEQNKNNQVNSLSNYFSIKEKSSPQKIVFLYDYYDNNFVNLVMAIFNMQYGNPHNNLKKYWEEIKQKFKIIHPEEIYLLEWYCLGINYNIIENSNQYKLNCVDLLK